jgi:valyl-tRNA synthetase
MLAGLAEVVAQATDSFEAYDYARALEVAERSFWSWTDDYLELVKARAYGEGSGAASAHAALQAALAVYLRLFAPFLPFVTEEVWSWWREGSVHRASWPTPSEFEDVSGDARIMDAISEVLTAVRRTKSDAKASMRAELERVTITAPAETVEFLEKAEPDLKAAARTEVVEYREGEFVVEAVLAEN